jgi:hypothetical protein
MLWVLRWFVWWGLLPPKLSLGGHSYWVLLTIIVILKPGLQPYQNSAITNV